MSNTNIPRFPEFVPVDLGLQEEMREYLAGETTGISEFTFAGLFLFRRRYGYQVSRDSDNSLVLTGSLGETKFFSCPCHCPEREVLDALFAEGRYWKNISQAVLDENREKIESYGIEAAEDRDNFDYLYLASDLATLSGKKFHKKRNLVNAFLLSYPEHTEIPLSPELVPDAMKVLERWRADKGEEGDYIASKEALELMETLRLSGMMIYIAQKPAAYCLGEGMANGKTYAMHFEKGIDDYKGIYQFTNQAYATVVAEKWTYINREQDLGEEGMRQAKMTYRPVGFVQKYAGHLKK